MMTWVAESVKTQVTFSFVIPFMNEEDVLVGLLVRITDLMGALDAPCEVVFVDDGSRDAGPSIIAAAARRDPRIKLIRLSRNFGHQIAVTAGLNAVRGKATIIMDADLQDPPEVVQDLVARWLEGYEIVHAQRRARRRDVVQKGVRNPLLPLAGTALVRRNSARRGRLSSGGRQGGRGDPIHA